jgi:serine/threonine protein kinase
MSELRDQLQRTLGDNYALERELGGGGMSRVFVAEETSLGRKVVVKVLPPDLAAAVNLERFRREIQLAAKLQHPHIVPVLAAGVSDGLPYYTMPFIEGESLRARISHAGPLPVNEAVRILRDTLSALSYAHEHGVVHRDIKPDNILLTDQHAVVADFGVAKALSASTNPGSSLTSLGVALGTPAYMSPEQAAADPTTDHRSDLYAVGAVAYEMLTGQQVFSARSPQAMLAAHAMESPEPLEKRRPSVPPPLAALIMRSLEKYAADRPQTAREMLSQLDAAVTPSGASTTPYTGTMPARKVALSPRSRWMAVGAAALLLLLGSSSWFWYGHRVAAATGESAAATAADSVPSLAILPFENLGKADDAYFADGMAEEISSRLGTLSGLRVIGRQSVRGYADSKKTLPEIGRELGVTYVLTGSVRWDRSSPGSNRVRVSPALLRIRDGTQVWSTPYEDDMTGVFKIQSKVAEQVAEALQVQLKGKEQQRLAARPTNNLEAYDFYLRGRALADAITSQSDYLRVVSFFKRAVELDPGFADGWAALASAHLSAFWFGADPTEKRLALAKQAIDRLSQLQPDAAQTHDMLGEYYYHGKLDYDRALAELARAQQLSPNDAQAAFLKSLIERRQNRWTEALKDGRLAVSIDPRNGGYMGALTETLDYVRDYAAEDSLARRLIDLQPDRFDGYSVLTRSQLNRGNVNDALETLREASRRVAPEQLVPGLSQFSWPVYQDKKLLRIVEEAEPPSSPSDRLDYYFARMVFAIYQNDPSARESADSVLALAPRVLTAARIEPSLLTTKAFAYLAKGDGVQALSYAKKAVEKMPVSRDAVYGASVLGTLGAVATRTGDYDVALDVFAQLLRIPSPVSKAQVRLDPWTAPLRGNPRFQALVAER